jgi:hypothetical protein
VREDVIDGTPVEYYKLYTGNKIISIILVYKNHK